MNHSAYPVGLSWAEVVKAARNIHAQCGIETQVTVRMAIAAFLKNAAFDADFFSHRGAFHEIGHVISGGISGSARDEGLAAIPEYVVMHGSYYAVNQKDIWSSTILPQTTLEDVKEGVIERLRGAAAYWHRAIKEENLKALSLKNTFQPSAAPEISRAERMQSDRFVTHEDIVSQYKRAQIAEAIFRASTAGYFVYQIPEAEFLDLPLAFLGMKMDGTPNDPGHPLNFAPFPPHQVETLLAALDKAENWPQPKQINAEDWMNFLNEFSIQKNIISQPVIELSRLTMQQNNFK